MNSAGGCHEPLQDGVQKYPATETPTPEEADMSDKNPVSIETTTPLGVIETFAPVKYPDTKRGR